MIEINGLLTAIGGVLVLAAIWMNRPSSYEVIE